MDELAVTAQDALDAFDDLRGRATTAGVAMADDTIALVPIPALAEAIKFAVTSGTQGRTRADHADQHQRAVAARALRRGR